MNNELDSNIHNIGPVKFTNSYSAVPHLLSTVLCAAILQRNLPLGTAAHNYDQVKRYS